MILTVCTRACSGVSTTRTLRIGRSRFCRKLLIVESILQSLQSRGLQGLTLVRLLQNNAKSFISNNVSPCEVASPWWYVYTKRPSTEIATETYTMAAVPSDIGVLVRYEHFHTVLCKHFFIGLGHCQCETHHRCIQFDCQTNIIALNMNKKAIRERQIFVFCTQNSTSTSTYLAHIVC